MLYRVRNHEQWHVIFAWVPHNVGGNRRAWLQFIERRCIYAEWPLWICVYRLIGDTEAG